MAHKVTPWEVSGKVDYDKLVKEFGVSKINNDLLKRIEKITKDSKGDVTLDDVIGSFGILGAVAEVEMELVPLGTSMEILGYSFKTVSGSSKYTTYTK